MSIESPKSKVSVSTGISPVLAAVVVLACLLAGSGFVWWYLKGPDSATVQLSTDDLVALQQAGRRVVGDIPQNRGAPMQIRPNGPLEPDGIVDSAFGSKVIRVGNVQVRVVPPMFGGTTPNIKFLQRNWGLLQDPLVFTIGRRVINEPALAKQLAMTPKEMDALKTLVQLPAVRGKYLSALPASPAEMERAAAAWADYTKGLASTKDAAEQERQKQVLLKTMQSIGSAALGRARREYNDAAKQLGAVIEPRQADAYVRQKTLSPLN
jgi:hypothetical protein